MTSMEFHTFIERVAVHLPEGCRANYFGTIYGKGFDIQSRMYKKVFQLRLKSGYANSAYWLKAIAKLVMDGELSEKDLMQNVPVGTSEKETADIITTQLIPVAEKIMELVKAAHDAVNERNLRVNTAMHEALGFPASDATSFEGHFRGYGGTVVSWYTRKDNDIDLRLGGLTEEQAVEVARTVAGFFHHDGKNGGD